MRRVCALALLCLGMIGIATPPASVAACTPTAVPRTPFPTLTAQQLDDRTRTEIQSSFQQADVVFRARVVSAMPVNLNNQMLERAEVVPLVTWKGSPAASLIVYNVRGNASSSSFTCAAPFYLMPNTEYLVYANDRGSKDGTYDAGTRTRAVTDADDDLRVLGAGTPVAAPTMTPIPLPATPSAAPSGTPPSPPSTALPTPAQTAPSPSTPATAPATTTRIAPVWLALIIIGGMAGIALAVGAIIRQRSRRP